MARSSLLRHLQVLLRETDRELHPEAYSRRDFLKTGAVVGGALALTPLEALAKIEKDARKLQPVAIVGMGAAGLMAAYELQKAGIPFQMFEASSRVGGRIFTDDRTFADQGQFCELGAELVNSDHETLHALAKELGLTLEDFAPGDKDLVTDLYVYEGIRYSSNEIKAAGLPLVKAVRADFKRIFGKAEPEVITATSPFRFNAQKYDEMSLAQYLDGQTSLPAWFRELMKIGYETESGVPADKQSVLTLFSMFMGFEGDWSTYGTSDETCRIKGGSSRLIEAVHKKIKTAINFKHQLIKVAEKNGKIDLTFQTSDEQKKLSFQQVLITVPLPVLRKIDGFSDQSLKLPSNVHKAIQELQYGFNSKTMLGFSQRVWRKSKKFDPCNGAVLSDLYTSVLWESSRLQKEPAGILTAYSGSQKAFDVSLSKVSTILSDIQTLFPGTKEAFNQKSAQFNWPKYPWALGSYSSPAPGQYTTLNGLLHKPFLGRKLYFAGEHVSLNFSSYMEGGLETGARAAKLIAASAKEFAV
ncbi:MAG: FAD-dependent oxidoreductase [Bdellovibrionaceae bacterium]|nr:FAD-dependent oxidoreductase [Pseudobdellovibrionaceae bacterium]